MSELAACIAAAEAAMRRGDQEAAFRLAGKAAGLGAERPQILVLAVFDCLSRNEAQRALDYAAKARAAARRDGEVLNAYALALSACGRFKEALAAFEAALRQAPGRAGFHYGKGCVFEKIGENARARQSFERAVALEPNHGLALSRLAGLAMERGDVAEARAYGERTLRLLPDEQAATLALAMADIEEKKFAAALSRLSPLLGRWSGINLVIAQGLCADALDGLGHRAEAFQAYTASNDSMRRLYRPLYEVPGQPGACALVEDLAAYFRAAPAEAWRAQKAGKAERTHVFLVGFPRSGTTLLEQVLLAHPDVESMEERLCFADAEAEFLSPAGLDKLAKLSGAQLEPWRQAYWQRVAENGALPARQVFIDKLPLNSVLLCLIAKLFPEAKILFALRDPADVVWSAFRRRFAISAQMYELLNLKRAVRYYGAVMSLSDLYRDKLELPILDVVYEKMVVDFEGETRRICDFLGLSWSESMAGFATKSRQRAPFTPSGVQVSRGLYTTAVGQWQAYKNELEPILPQLTPWRVRFGYQEASNAPQSP
jgi:Tfp pilus assembly protein PilF